MSDIQTIQPPAELATDVHGIRQWAATLVVRTKDEYADASERLKQIKTVSKRMADWFRPMKQTQDAAKKALLDAEKLFSLDESEKLAKAALLKFENAENAKAAAESARINAIAAEASRKEREIVEAEAAKQRLIEAEARRKAEEARKRAEEASASDRRRLLEQATRAESKANAAAEKADNKTTEAASIQPPTIRVEADIPKVAGQQTRRAWKHEVVNLEQALLWCCENKRTDLLLLNETMLAGMATSMKERANVPGVKFEEKSTLAVRGA